MQEDGSIDPSHWPDVPPTVPAGSPAADRAGGQPDPGSIGSARVAVLVTIPLMLLIVIIQQWQAFSSPPTPGGTKGEGEGGSIIAPPEIDQFTVTTKLIVRVLGQIESGESGEMLTAEVANVASTDAERLRVAIVAGELQSGEAALERIEVLRDEWSDEPSDEQQLLLEDAEQLQRLYTEGVDTLDDESKKQLTEHHGWFGELALVYDVPSTDPIRQELMAGGMALLIVMLLVMLGLFFGFFGGVALLITGAALFSSGKLKAKFRPPAPGGSVYIEMLPVFVVGFFVLQIVAGLVASAGFPGAEHIALSLQWLLLGVLAWPIFRGVPAKRAAIDLGWRLREGGVLKEIGFGLLAYLAAIPVYIIAALVTVAMLFIYQMMKSAVTGPQPTQPPSNPIIDMVTQSGPLGLVLLFTLATIWAPVVEETVFRGAVYRYLRQRFAWLFAGLLSALLFGLMHQYQLFMLLPVISLGIVFAAIREWRGSLIASVTAHGVHNGLVLGTLLTVMYLAAN